jgi:hypothetical protein
VNKPVVGQWWQYSTDRRYVVGCTTDGNVVLQKPDGKTHLACPEYMQKTWKHLPDCTGWDWEPETFPQYWTTLDTTKDGFAFVVRTSEHEWHGVSYDGKHCPATLNHWHTQGGPYRKRLTEAEALALLDKPQPLCKGCGNKLRPENAWMEDGCPCNSPKGVNDPQPAEDPEEWVEITDPEHVLREGVDYVRTATIPNGEWCKVYGYRGQKLAATGCIARCRRKDLPAKKRTVTVPKWLCRSWGNWQVVECSVPLGWDEVHRVGETTYEIE